MPRHDSQTPADQPPRSGPSPNVDDGLTSLSWLQNLNMCMTRLGAPTPPTPPASPNQQHQHHHHHKSAGSHLSGLYFNLETPSCSSSSSSSRLRSQQQSSSNTRLAQHPCTNSIPVSNQSSKKSSKPSSQNPNNKATRTSGQQLNGCTPIDTSSSTSSSIQQETIDYKSNGSTKPPYSYATLICMAMKANKNKMTLNSIYKWIRENFLYYQRADPSWQVRSLFTPFLIVA